MRNENDLLDLAREMLKAKNDAQLSRALGVAPPVISKTRHGRLAVGAVMTLGIHEATGLAVREIKSYITHGPMVARQVAK